ncbi:hypothetical protein [Actinacidiphila paucisporea]|uniref:SseB protein N-terminal domain-containing protein n=1 Tax=Actinacidiphila paucisporea TaxID=310782 RepID=A0A1M7KKR3_9ACTN|nr:hypothetical protein [Actinacidiphila paucisporea]SHM65990.1 hypothetical protein SAMN05216499_11313 [Actinacidiphila paucisporea]
MKSDWDRLFGSGGDAAPVRPDGGGLDGAGAADLPAGDSAAEAAWSGLTDLVDGVADRPPVPVAAAFGMLPSAQDGAHAALVSELADLHAGNGDPDALLDAFRASLVMVPTLEGGDLWATSMGGVHWVYAFSDDTELARFAVARGADGSSDVDFVTVYGWRLLDEVVPAVGQPAGVALDVAGGRPMIFPPVAGVVPDGAAVDTAAVNGEER